MTALAESDLVERFRAAITRQLGLYFDDSRIAFLGSVLERRAQATGAAASHYIAQLDGRAAREELRELVRELTVAETYFFRHAEQFQAFVEAALPERLAARSHRRQLRILSAGCASGEEAYSLAILARERVVDPGWTISVQGVDVNPLVLQRAARGRYSAWAFRETPADVQRRWFSPEERDFVLSESIRAAVTFEERNLSLEEPDLWQKERFDVVFCRNVIMYFAPDVAERLIARIAGALSPGGYLFLGHAETLRGLSHDFHLRHTHGAFYYQRKETVAASMPASIGAETFAGVEDALPGAAAPLEPGLAVRWPEAVARAADRIRALADGNEAPPAARPLSEAPPAPDLSVPLELFKEERFAEALELLGRLPSRSAASPDAMLLRAILLTHSGDFHAAERVCEPLVAIDELSAGAHYLRALCAEGLGDRARAVDDEQTAMYLDPSFAMPHLHVGLMARRAGDRATAERELAQAALLLAREDATRILLFGGGFNRDSLVALCQAELRRLGGAP